MSKIRKNNFYYLLIIVVQVNSCYPQGEVWSTSKIEKCFSELKNKSRLVPQNSEETYFPFYESFDTCSKVKEENIKSGALCKQYLRSEQLLLLKKIYLFSVEEDNNELYNLVDPNGNIIYDLVRYNCSGMKKQFGTIDTINQDVINELLFSYEKWYQLVVDNGFKDVQIKKLTPISFTKYRWVKEIGYLSSSRSSNEILEIYFTIKKDSNYLHYFIKTNDLYRFYEDKTANEILDELIILTILNSSRSFTSNILDFNLDGSKNDIHEVIEMLEDKKESLYLFHYLKEKNIRVNFKI